MTNFEDQIKRLKTEEQEPDPEKYIQFFGTFWTVKFIYLMIFLGTFLLVGFVSCLLRPTVISEKKQPFPYTQQAIPSTPSMPEVRNITLGDGSVYCETGCEITNQTIINPAPSPTQAPTQCQLIQDPTSYYNEVPIYDPNSPSWFMGDIPGWPLGAVTNASNALDIHGISQDNKFLLITIPGIGRGWTPYAVSVDIAPPGCQPPVMQNPFPDPCVLRLRASFGLFFNKDGKPLFRSICTD